MLCPQLFSVLHEIEAPDDLRGGVRQDLEWQTLFSFTAHEKLDITGSIQLPLKRVRSYRIEDVIVNPCHFHLVLPHLIPLQSRGQSRGERQGGAAGRHKTLNKLEVGEAQPSLVFPKEDQSGASMC